MIFQQIDHTSRNTPACLATIDHALSTCAVVPRGLDPSSKGYLVEFFTKKVLFFCRLSLVLLCAITVQRPL